MDRPFDLVVFDLGGVLVRIARTWEEAHALAGLEGTPLDDPVFLVRLGELAHEQDGSRSSAQFFELVAAASGGVYDVADVRRASDAVLRDEVPGVGLVFDQLDEAGVETAILSNTNDAHWARLAPSSGDAEFPTVLCARHLFASHLLGLMKPDPAIFRLVERETGHPPSRILFFDDLEANVAGARKAGWTAGLVDPEADPAAQLLAALQGYGVIA